MQALSLRRLGLSVYSAAEIESILAHVGTMDDFLLQEGTYYLAEVGRAVVASGGWSVRVPAHAHLGSAAAAAARGGARIRSVFTHPDFGRRGLARRLIERAETEAAAAGLAEIGLTATLSGVPLYRKLGYEAERELALDLPDGGVFRAVAMRKALGSVAADSPAWKIG